MPEPMLTAAQVQAMVRRWGRAQLVDAATLRQAWDDLDALTRQDAAWRALVEAVLQHVEHSPHCPAAAPMYVEYCECGLNAVLAQAQAALDGTA